MFTLVFVLLDYQNDASQWAHVINFVHVLCVQNPKRHMPVWHKVSHRRPFKLSKIFNFVENRACPLHIDPKHQLILTKHWKSWNVKVWTQNQQYYGWQIKPIQCVSMVLYSEYLLWGKFLRNHDQLYYRNFLRVKFLKPHTYLLSQMSSSW